MALLDRIAPTDSNIERIPVHQFGAAMQGLARGSVTRDQVISFFNLSSQDETQLDALKTVYDGKGGGVAKLEYIIWIERVLMLYEQRVISKSTVASLLEIT